MENHFESVVGHHTWGFASQENWRDSYSFCVRRWSGNFPLQGLKLSRSKRQCLCLMPELSHVCQCGPVHVKGACTQNCCDVMSWLGMGSIDSWRLYIAPSEGTVPDVYTSSSQEVSRRRCSICSVHEVGFPFSFKTCSLFVFNWLRLSNCNMLQLAGNLLTANRSPFFTAVPRTSGSATKAVAKAAAAPAASGTSAASTAKSSEGPDLRGEWGNLALLCLLYLGQIHGSWYL